MRAVYADRLIRVNGSTGMNERAERNVNTDRLIRLNESAGRNERAERDVNAARLIIVNESTGRNGRAERAVNADRLIVIENYFTHYNNMSGIFIIFAAWFYSINFIISKSYGQERRGSRKGV